MRKALVMRIGMLLLAVTLCLSAGGSVRKRKTQKPRNPDSLVVAMRSPEMPSSGKMRSSAYPVQISIIGRAIQIQSDHNQLLPIYTRNGVLYLTTRLNKGTNWLGGLPQGHYFINNKPITIN